MSVQKEPSGRRSVQVEVEVPGTPEEVWQAIATGEGVSSWFVPTRVITDAQGAPTKVEASFGPGMDSVATVTAWDPPRRFAAESADFGPNAPPIATEWIVEARSGGTCVVRVVHSLFASTDDWDDQLHQIENGWPGFFRILRLYLTHFRGQRASTIQLVTMTSGPEAAVWDRLMKLTGFAGVKIGDRRSSTAPDMPPFGGVVEQVFEEKYHELLVRLDRPAPGLVHVFAMDTGGQIFLIARFYLFGADAPAVVARDEPRWQAVLQQHFALLGA